MERALDESRLGPPHALKAWIAEGLEDAAQGRIC